ncbi:PilN domain-containing protein [bacterium]|nr:PilN domain-containing protein [bacterium]
MKFLWTALMERAAGVDIGPSGIRIVELGRRFNRIFLLNHDEEPLDSFYSPAVAVQRALSRLYDRSPHMTREAVIHTEGKGIRHMTADAPVMDASSLDGWVTAQVMQRLPEGIAADDLSIAHHILSASENGYKLWITYCQARIVSEKREWMESAHVNTASVGGDILDMHHAYIPAGDIPSDQLQGLILIRENETVCTLAGNGRPVMTDTLPHEGRRITSDAVWNRCLKRWQESGNLNLHRVIWVDGRFHDEETEPLSLPDSKSPWPVMTENPLSAWLDTESPLPPRFGLAAGLALKRLYPSLNTIDLLPDTEKRRVRDRTEKRRAMTWILAVGGIFVLLLFILNLLHIASENSLAASEDRITAMNDQIISIELAKKEQARLSRTLQNMHQLMVNRSGHAALFEEISRVVPAEIWLQGLILEPVYDGRLRDKIKTGDRLDIRGWALSDSRITTLISNLESSKFLKDIRLEEREQLTSDDVLKQTGEFSVPLIHFRVTAGLAVREVS